MLPCVLSVIQELLISTIHHHGSQYFLAESLPRPDKCLLCNCHEFKVIPNGAHGKNNKTQELERISRRLTVTIFIQS